MLPECVARKVPIGNMYIIYYKIIERGKERERRSRKVIEGCHSQSLESIKYFAEMIFRMERCI